MSNEDYEILNEKALFELDGTMYTLKFNMNKVKTIEKMHGISLMAELQQTNGILSFSLLEGLFAVGLHDITDEKAIKGKKAQQIYEQLLKDMGWTDIVAITVGKLQEDLAFLFPAD